MNTRRIYKIKDPLQSTCVSWEGQNKSGLKTHHHHHHHRCSSRDAEVQPIGRQYSLISCCILIQTILVPKGGKSKRGHQRSQC